LLLAAVAALSVRGFWIEPRDVEPVAAALRCPHAGRDVRALLFSDVGFRGVGRREREVARAAAGFTPDVVLVAGDFFDDGYVLDDPETAARGARFLESLPARAGRFFVPGELETKRLREVRALLEPGTTVLVNESRRIELPEACLEVFGANEMGDQPPWGAGVKGPRAFVRSRHAPGRGEHRLRFDGPGASSWRPREATLAFQPASPDARVVIVVGGRRIARHEERSDFTADPALQGRTASGFTPRKDAWYRARIDVRPDADGTRVRARFWEEGQPEPSAWSIDARDPADRTGPVGTIELGGLWGEARYADVEVRGDGGELLLKEGFEDEAAWRSRWDSGSSIERWLLATAASPCARVILTHSPDVVRYLVNLEAMEGCPVLAGHTHGGQVRVPGFGALYSSTWIGRKYDRGLFDFGGVPLYITAGVSTTILPVRLFDPPEVTLLTLKR